MVYMFERGYWEWGEGSSLFFDPVVPDAVLQGFNPRSTESIMDIEKRDKEIIKAMSKG